MAGARQRRAALGAIHDDLFGADEHPAEEGDPGQLALQQKGIVGGEEGEGEGLPDRLVLGRQNEGALGHMLDAAKLDLHAADDAQQPDRDPRPGAREHEDGMTAKEHDRRAQNNGYAIN